MTENVMAEIVDHENVYKTTIDRKEDHITWVNKSRGILSDGAGNKNSF